jgi:hypothetical protein
MSMAQANGEHRNPEQPRSVGGILLILYALLGPPAIWITHFNIMYFLVQPVCRLGGEVWFHAASVVALVGIIGAGVAAWMIGRRYGDGLRAALDGEGSWKGFVGVYGLGSALLFGYAVIYTWSPVFSSLGTCTGM